MIRRLYLDGYKAFVNHTIEFDRLVFLAGGNGTGKSGHFDAIEAVRNLVVEGKPVAECFPPSCFSQFSKPLGGENPRIVVEMDMETFATTFEYVVIVERSPAGIEIHSERLLSRTETLYEYEGGLATVATDRDSVAMVSISSHRSGLPLIRNVTGGRGGPGFLTSVSTISNVRLNPWTFANGSSPAKAHLIRDGGNLAGWLADQMADFTKAAMIVERWTRALGVSVNPRFVNSPEGNVFELELRYGRETQTARLSDLSEGQRCLLAIHALLADIEADGGTLLLDEPDNFLSYAEVQGLIGEIQSASLREGAQIIVASHNPALMRELGGVYGVRFYRDGANGHVRYTDLAKESAGIDADLVVLDGELGP